MNSISSFCKPFLQALVLLASIFFTEVRAEELYTADGNKFDADIITMLDDDTVVLRVEGEDIEIDFTALAKESVYLVRLHFVDPANALERYNLGLFCFENDLYYLARREFRAARNLDPEMSPLIDNRLAEMSEEQAKERFGLAMAKVEDGDLASARILLETLLAEFPDTSTAADARSVMTMIDRRQGVVGAQQNPAAGQNPPAAQAQAPAGAQNQTPQDQNAARPRSAREQREEDSRVAEIQTTLERCDELIELSRQKYREGLLFDAETQTSRAVASYREAEQALQVVIQGCSRVLRIATTAETASIDRANTLGDSAERRLVNVYLSLANLYAGDKNIDEAHRYVNMALAIDETNEWALRLRHLVTEHRMQRSVRERYPNPPASGTNPGE
ncbi:MAG: hypothetical protein NUW37_17095 [Planctomycetes bacterium]|nr:hypothetical protein [Planctomycetota bacterium]